MIDFKKEFLENEAFRELAVLTAMVLSAPDSAGVRRALRDKFGSDFQRLTVVAKSDMLCSEGAFPRPLISIETISKIGMWLFKDAPAATGRTDLLIEEFNILLDISHDKYIGDSARTGLILDYLYQNGYVWPWRDDRSKEKTWVLTSKGRDYLEKSGHYYE